MNIESIIHAKLTSVVFIRDYVQLLLDGDASEYCLTIYDYPKVHKNNRELSYGHIGYCDSLCSFIGQLVTNAYDIDEVAIQIFFGEKDRIIVSLNPEEFSGPEAMMMTTHGAWNVWR